MVLFRFGCSIYKIFSSDENFSNNTGQIQRQNMIPETSPPKKKNTEKKHTQSDHRRPPSPQPRSGVRPSYQTITSTN